MRLRYGMRVRREIEDRTATLERLEAKGLVRSDMGERTQGARRAGETDVLKPRAVAERGGIWQS